jgi:hypothetical protein
LKTILKWVLAPVAVIWFLGWAYIQINYPTCTFRYKLTAEVNTPDGVKTGSSVIEVSYSHNGDWGGGETPNLNLSGEAVYVDLGAGKNLFVTLTTSESGRENYDDRHWISANGYNGKNGPLNPFALPLKIMGVNWSFGQERMLCNAVASLSQNRKIDVPFANLPTLTTFADLHDLNSVKVVQPEKLSDVFGIGFSLKRATIELTTDQLIDKIAGVLVWLPVKKLEWSKYQDRAFLQGPLINQLYYDAFKAPGIWGDGGSGL